MKNKKLKISVFLLFVNIFSLVISSYAWFMIKPVESESNNITIYSGDYLYVSLDPVTGYQPTLDFQEDIVGGIYETGHRLIPVTSYNGVNFFRKNGMVYNHPVDPEDRWYFEFDLYLKSKTNKNVYLGEDSGFTCAISSTIEKSARVSYTTYINDATKEVEKTIIWESIDQGIGGYGEGIYDNGYLIVENPDYVCSNANNPSGYILCPSTAMKTAAAAITYDDYGMAIPLKAPEGEVEDLTGIPPIISLVANAEYGRLLTLRVWIEGFDPDSNHLFELSNEAILMQLDFSMTLYFASRDI